MEFRIEYAARVHHDLDSIYQYIAKRSGSHETAANWCAKITDHILTLRTFPTRCATAPENKNADEHVYHTFVGVYRIIFSVDSSTVRILHIRHGGRLPADKEIT